MNCHSSNPARYVKVKSIVVLNPVRISTNFLTELQQPTTLDIADHCLYRGLLTNHGAIVRQRIPHVVEVCCPVHNPVRVRTALKNDLQLCLMSAQTHVSDERTK